MSNVYLIAANRAETDELVHQKIDELWQAAGFDPIFKPNDLAAIKLHVGEPGTQTYLNPAVAAATANRIRHTGATPFLTDTAVLYRSPRDNAVGHAQVALEHGFGPERIGAPFLLADGLTGTDAQDIPVDGRHFREVSIANGILHARSMLVLSHATGHLATGFGGALKNLGMGCSSKKAKLKQHFGQKPRIQPKKCISCGECITWCPSQAITLENKARINSEHCIGCGECVAICREGAVAYNWSVVGPQLQERMVEHAAAVVSQKKGRIAYLTAAQTITKDCDCLGVKQPPLLEDIGFLASADPVSLDKAVLDLIIERSGNTLESMAYPKTDSATQISYAETMGLGEAAYQLNRIG